MASPLETYLNKMNKIDKLTDVNLPGGVSVYNKADERKKASNEYLSSLPKRPDAPEFRLIGSPSREDRRYRQQNQAMDSKIVEEGKIMNQFDMARGLGGREGIEKIKEIAESTPGGVNIFNKMNEGQITFSELMGALPNPKNLPYKPSDTDMMQMENLITKNGMMPDDIRANPAMNRVFEVSPRLQRLAQKNVDKMLMAEEDQIASKERDRQYNQQKRMEEAAYMDEILKDKRYFGPGLDLDKMNLLAKDFVKYGDDNLMQVAGLLGSDLDNKIGGEHAYLNIRSKLSEHGATKDKLKEFDDMFSSNKIKNMDMNLRQSVPKKMFRTPKQVVEDRMLADSQIKKVKGPNVPQRKQSKVKEGLLKASLEGTKFAKALTGNQDWKQYVQEGGFISKLGDFGKGVYDRYIGNPIAAGKTENIMAEQGLDRAQAKHLRDVEGQGKADFSDALGRGLNQAGRDVVTGAGAVVGGTLAVPGLVGKGLQAGYKGLTDNKASYEDLASGKEKGSLLQRLGKGMAFAGNAIDVMNAPDPSQAMGQVDIKFSSGKGKDKVQQMDLGETDVNKDLTVPTEDVPNPGIEGSKLQETSVQNKIDQATKDIPSPMMTDEMDAKTRQQLMVDAGIDIGQSGANQDGVDGQFGPKSEAGWKQYTDMVQSGNYTTDADGKLVYDFSGDVSPPPEIDYSRRVPFAKQQGGFITGLMKYQRGGLV